MASWRENLVAAGELPHVGERLMSPVPAWIWLRDGSRVLWANVSGGNLLKAATLGELFERRWPKNHALRRSIASLARALPEKGVLARLRLVEDHHSLPIACQCSDIRVGGERGVLIVGLEGLRKTPSLGAFTAFFGGAGGNAAVLDSAGAVLAETKRGAAAAIGRATPCLEFDHGGKMLRLYLMEHTAEEKALVVPPSPALDNAGLTIKDAPPLTEPAEARAADLPPVPEDPSPVEKAQVVETAATAPKPVAQEELVQPAPAQAAPAVPAGPARQRKRQPRPPPLKRAPDEAPPAAKATEPAKTPARSVMAGRVAQELSRKPVRFLWQTDAADRFLFVSPGLTQVVGRNADIVGERWTEVAERLRIDPGGRIIRALREHDTWSGLNAWWPIEGSNVRVPVELTALPVFGGDQSFQGYRGFGVLRPAEALMPAAFEARFDPADATPAEQIPPYEEAPGGAANVVPIRSDIERIDHALTQQERNAFEEIAAALRERVVGVRDEAPKSAEPLEAADVPQGVEAAGAAGAAEAPEAVDVPEAVEAAVAVEAADAVEEVNSASEPTESPPASTMPALQPVAEVVAPEDRTEPKEEPGREEVPEREESQPHASARREPPREIVIPRSVAPQRDPALAAKLSSAERRLRETTAILDTATDGVIIVDAEGVIESVNGSAEALFGLDAEEMEGRPIGALLTSETRKLALDYLSGLKDSGVASLLNEGREVEAIAGIGSIPLFMTMGRISSGEGGRFCAVLRDITHWKRIESELRAAKAAAERASSQKSEFLARVSHEIRTPLNTIIGFAEVMIEERFGAVANERYREYLRDIRTSGEHLVSLVNDLLDISKIEAGKLDLTFAAVSLNDVVRESIGLMQPQANRARVVVRSSLSREVPAIVADERTLRQIVLNLLSNSVKFTGPGGQVIASTSLTERGEALLRVRDTGEGMTDDELARALEPFRQLSTATMSGPAGTGLGLPLTKALVEANRATLTIKSARGEGTVVTVTIPPTRVLSE